jgi:hypothetical protein
MSHESMHHRMIAHMVNCPDRAYLDGPDFTGQRSVGSRIPTVPPKRLAERAPALSPPLRRLRLMEADEPTIPPPGCSNLDPWILSSRSLCWSPSRMIPMPSGRSYGWPDRACHLLPGPIMPGDRRGSGCRRSRGAATPTRPVQVRANRPVGCGRTIAFAARPLVGAVPPRQSRTRGAVDRLGLRAAEEPVVCEDPSGWERLAAAPWRTRLLRATRGQVPCGGRAVRYIGSPRNPASSRPIRMVDSRS